MYSKDFLPIYNAFIKFAHILWEATKRTINLTENKSLTRFFQVKAIPLALWNACDHVLQLNSKETHIADSVNTAADFLSGLEHKFTEKIRLKIMEDIQTTPLEVTKTSLDVDEEEKFFFTQADNKNESEELTLHWKEQSWQIAREWVAKGEPSSFKTIVYELKKIGGNTTSYFLIGMKANVQIRVEQNVDIVLKKTQQKFLDPVNDEGHLTTDTTDRRHRI